MEDKLVSFKKNEIICKQGESVQDIYQVVSGKILIFLNKGTMITPLTTFGDGEFFGEMAFFADYPRIANAIALEDTQLVQVADLDIKKEMPKWLLNFMKDIIVNISKSTEMVAQKGIRMSSEETIKPLSIEEQRRYYKILTES